MSSLFLRSSQRGPGRRPWGPALALFAGVSVFALTALTALAPPPQSAAIASGDTSGAGGTGSQTLSVTADAGQLVVTRDGYQATEGVESFIAGSTNEDWAKLVLMLADFPVSDSNVTVMLRWMRQENGPDDWWNRNNPLNNGWGSGGGSGLGSYDTLVTAAENVGNALHGNSGYSAIVAGFAASAPTEQIEAAIWASPWASSHYANGSHWSYTAVPVIASPSGTWG